MFCTKIVLVDEYSCSIFILSNCCNYNTFLHSLKKNIFSSKNITAGVWKLWEKKPKWQCPTVLYVQSNYHNSKLKFQNSIKPN